MDHGVTIIATGGKAYTPTEYGYGSADRVYTSIEFDKLTMMGDRRIKMPKPSCSSSAWDRGSRDACTAPGSAARIPCRPPSS